MRFTSCLPLLLLTPLAISAQENIKKSKTGFAIAEKFTEKKIDVLFNSQLLTSFLWYDSLFKPVLHPINTVTGIPVTRHFPLSLVPNERADHPHQVGLFFTHESVNGFDFWNLSPSISPVKRNMYGKIEFVKVLKQRSSRTEARLDVVALWKTYEGNALLEETTRFLFRVVENDFIIDRSTTLRVVADRVVFKDAKDALLGLRVARELELPNNWKDPLVKQDGTLSAPETDNSVATGNYINSEGIKGESVWGMRARWLCLTGEKSGNKISIVIFDHPSNLEYPVFWHARGYGLFAANPLGRKIFTNKDELNFTLSRGKSQQFHYRILVHEGEPFSVQQIDNLADRFAKEF